MDQREAFFPLADVLYAIAEALFGLIATSVPAAASFREATHASPSIRAEDVDQRIGSLATSMILFPRAAAERYCCARFGEELMKECTRLAKMDELASHERAAIEAEARSFAERTLRALEDNEPRPGLEELDADPDGDDYRWPTFAPLVNEAERMQLRDAMRRVFEPLTAEGVEDRLTDTTRDVFARTLKRCEGEALQALEGWRERSETAAGDGRARLLNELDQTMAELWLRDDKGAARAKAYAERLDRAFDKLSERLSRWRERHEEDYHSVIAQLTSAADGPWVLPRNSPEPVGEGPGRSATPTLAGYEIKAQTYVPPSDANDLFGDGPPPFFVSDHESDHGANATGDDLPPLASEATLPPLDPTQRDRESGDVMPSDLEMTVIPNLVLRLNHLRTQIPTPANLVAANLIAAPPLLLLLLALLPVAWRGQPLLMGSACVALLGLMTLVSWLYRRAALRRVDQAEFDLLEAYRIHCLFLAREWEDQLRIVILSPLARRVKRMTQRLEEISVFFNQMAEELKREAKRTEADLFDGPHSVRDVFIANRQELTLRDGYRLEDFYGEAQRRALATADDNTSAQALNGRLRAYFAQAGVSIFGLSNNEISDHISQFSQRIILPVLTGELVSVSAALTAPGDIGARIWRNALGKASVLYRPYNNAPILTYICGRDEHRATVPETAIPAATTMIATRHTEWILVARLWTGGASTPWGGWSHLEATLVLPAALPVTPHWRDEQN